MSLIRNHQQWPTQVGLGAIRHCFFSLALPSEHGAWSVNFRGMRKQKKVKPELLAGVFHGIKGNTKQTKQIHTTTPPQQTQTREEPVKNSQKWQMSVMSTSSSPCSGGSLTSGKSRRRLSWYVPFLVCHRFAQWSICINLGTSILFLVPECMYEAINVQDQRRTLVFVIPYPLLTLLPPPLWSGPRYAFSS